LSKPPVPKKKPQIRWKDEYYEFIRNQYPHHTTAELSAMMFEAFGVSVSPSAVGFQIWRLRVSKNP